MYLISLTTNESEILEDYVKTCPVPTIRLRAHALLIRDKRLSLSDISNLVFRLERSITRWFIDNENASKLKNMLASYQTPFASPTTSSTKSSPHLNF